MKRKIKPAASAVVGSDSFCVSRRSHTCVHSTLRCFRLVSPSSLPPSLPTTLQPHSHTHTHSHSHSHPHSHHNHHRDARPWKDTKKKKKKRADLRRPFHRPTRTTRPPPMLHKTPAILTIPAYSTSPSPIPIPSPLLHPPPHPRLRPLTPSTPSRFQSRRPRTSRSPGRGSSSGRNSGGRVMIPCCGCYGDADASSRPFGPTSITSEEGRGINTSADFAGPFVRVEGVGEVDYWGWWPG